MTIRSKLVWLLIIPIHAIVALAFIENDSSIQLPPATSTACVSDPDPNNFLIQYANPECVPKWLFSYRDPVFHASVGDERIMRLTDALNIGIKGASHIYSSVNAFNVGNTKVIIGHRLLNGGENIAIYDIATGTYTLAPPGISTNAQPRWSRTNPNLIYLMPPITAPAPVYIKQYDVSTGIMSNVGGPLSFNGHTYDSIIQHPTEDDICFGGDHLIKRVAWQGTEFVVVFSISQQMVVGEYAITGLQPGDSVDNVEIAAAATAADRAADRKDIVLINFVKHESSGTSFNTWGRAIWKFTFDESQPPADRLIRNQQAVTVTAHHDIGLDDDGTPIIVTPNGSMYNPVPGCQGSGKFGIEKISMVNPDGNLPSAQRTVSKCLLHAIDWATQDVHVSLGTRAGWAFMDVNRISSDDTPTGPNPTGNWKTYANEIVQLKLDGTVVRRLAHHRARLTNRWYNQPVASVSSDGKKLAFVSNFGYGNYDITQYNDVYIIDNIDTGAPTEPPPPPPPSYTLSVSKSGTGTGTVTSDLPGINCGTQCSANYSNGTQVTLTASANADSMFVSWSGACSGTGGCVLPMDAARNIGATFNVTPPPPPPPSYTLSVFMGGTGNGTVTSDLPGINCGTACSASYNSATPVTLTASASSGSMFAGWSGACTGTGGCVLTMDAAKNVGATFNVTPTEPPPPPPPPPTSYTLSVSTGGTGTGTITSNLPGMNCQTTCSADYIGGTQVTLTAVADAGSTFAGWSGACTGSGACVVIMDAAKNVSATFNLTTVNYVRVEQGSSAVTYIGSWYNSRNEAVYSGGSAARAFVQGNRAVFTFTGTSGRWIGYNDPLSGIAKVYVDGVLQGQVDTFYNSGPHFQAQQVNYTTPPLPPGTHTLVIEVSGTRNSNSWGNWIWVDAFEYQP